MVSEIFTQSIPPFLSKNRPWFCAGLIKSLLSTDRPFRAVSGTVLNQVGRVGQSVSLGAWRETWRSRSRGPHSTLSWPVDCARTALRWHLTACTRAQLSGPTATIFASCPVGRARPDRQPAETDRPVAPQAGCAQPHPFLGATPRWSPFCISLQVSARLTRAPGGPAACAARCAYATRSASRVTRRRHSSRR